METKSLKKLNKTLQEKFKKMDPEAVESYRDLLKRSKRIDPEAAKILYDALWGLYQE